MALDHKTTLSIAAFVVLGGIAVGDAEGQRAARAYGRAVWC